MLAIIISGVSTVNTTESDLEQNKALRVDSELEKMWAVVMISWIIVYVKGKNICVCVYICISFLKIELMIDFYKITSVSGGLLAWPLFLMTPPFPL